jgi:hypothetical protein
VHRYASPARHGALGLPAENLDVMAEAGQTGTHFPGHRGEARGCSRTIGYPQDANGATPPCRFPSGSTVFIYRSPLNVKLDALQRPGSAIPGKWVVQMETEEPVNALW